MSAIEEKSSMTPLISAILMDISPSPGNATDNGAGKEVAGDSVATTVVTL